MLGNRSVRPAWSCLPWKGGGGGGEDTTQQSQCCHIGKAILCGTATLESWEGEGALCWDLIFLGLS